MIPDIKNLTIRSKMLSAMRDWFINEDFTEVETPVRIAAPAPELHIDCPRSGKAWLRASPELQMKRLIAAGMTKIYQIGPCFREGECGSRHNPEFTMLEWYRAGAGCDDILDDTISLLRHTASALPDGGIVSHNGYNANLFDKWEEISVKDAFLRWAGWDPTKFFDQDRFDEDMALKVEPALPKDVPCVLYNYPAQAASLARLRPDDYSVAERWELYVCGIEIANAYGELANGAEQRSRFELARRERQKVGEDDYPFDELFLHDLESGAFPPCGGIAVGIDRLAMLFTAASSISDVRAFCQSPGELI